MVTVRVEDRDAVRIVTIDRPAVRNAVDGPTAQQLYDLFVDFDGDDDVSVAVLTGAGGTFCAGADLKAISDGRGNSVLDVEPGEIVGSLGPMGPTRLQLSKPVIAAVEGHAVAGGLELACWADLRVAARDATFGVYCRRWGVPLVDGGTVRLPRLIGQSRAADLILTGRGVDGSEAERIGLVNRVIGGAEFHDAALDFARDLATRPPSALALTKRLLYGLDGADFAEGIARGAEVNAIARSTEACREGVRRFLDKS